MTTEEKKERIKDFRPIDDVFFEALAANKGVCEEILQTILNDKELEVIESITQSSEKNIYGRSVRLDVLCILGDGTKCNIEVQRSDNDNHLKRARFNASSITVKDSNTGDRFEDILDLYVVYISQFDVFHEGKTMYHLDKTIRETGTVVDDGLYEIFVNTSIKDGTDVSELMECFLQKEVDNPKFPNLSNEVYRLKHTEGGAESMCEIMEKYTKEAREEGREEGRKEGRMEGRREGRLESIADFLSNGGTEEDAKRFLHASSEEILAAKGLLSHV